MTALEEKVDSIRLETRKISLNFFLFLIFVKIIVRDDESNKDKTIRHKHIIYQRIEESTGGHDAECSE